MVNMLTLGLEEDKHLLQVKSLMEVTLVDLEEVGDRGDNLLQQDQVVSVVPVVLETTTVHLLGGDLVVPVVQAIQGQEGKMEPHIRTIIIVNTSHGKMNLLGLVPI